MITIRELIAEKMGHAMFIEAAREDEIDLLEKYVHEVSKAKNVEPETVIGLVRKDMEVYPNRYFCQSLKQVAGDKWEYHIVKDMKFERNTAIPKKEVLPPVPRPRFAPKPLLKKIVKKEATPQPLPEKPKYAPLVKKTRQVSLDDIFGGD